MATLEQTNSYFRLSCAIGVLLSSYALFVEVNKEANSNYKAYCDINEYISCTKAFSSEYGRGFGIIGSVFGEDSVLNQPNSVAGIVFYLMLLLMSYSNSMGIIQFQTVFCMLSNFMSAYLAYILYCILKDFCVVCVGTYIVSAINLALSISKWNIVSKYNSEQAKLSKKLASKKD